jgi:hypothetical protein
LRSNRVAARAELGKDPSSLEKFKSDVRLIRKNGWVDDVEAQKALRWARAVSGCLLSPVAEFGNAFLLRAVSTAEDPAVRLDSVSDHRAPTVSADRRERVNRTLEAVERVRVACAHDLERLVIVVTAYLADGHLLLLSYSAGSH